MFGTLRALIYLSSVSNVISDGHLRGLKTVTPCADVWDVVADGHRCGSRVTWIQRNEGKSRTSAEQQVAKEYPKECGACAHTLSPTPAPSLPPGEECLCLFDVDRTLTGKQDDIQQCSKNAVTKCPDNAYGSGDLTLSELGQSIGETFCKQCYVGIVTTGDAHGSNSCERKRLEQQLNVSGKLMSAKWSGPSRDRDDRKNCENWPVESAMVAGCVDGTKQFAAQGIVNWLKTRRLNIPKKNVWFFDDRPDNVQGFIGTGMNARQISCASRNPGYETIGFCGAEKSEIVPEVGVHTCD